MNECRLWLFRSLPWESSRSINRYISSDWIDRPQEIYCDVRREGKKYDKYRIRLTDVYSNTIKKRGVQIRILSIKLFYRYNKRKRRAAKRRNCHVSIGTRGIRCSSQKGSSPPLTFSPIWSSSTSSRWIPIWGRFRSPWVGWSWTSSSSARSFASSYLHFHVVSRKLSFYGTNFFSNASKEASINVRPVNIYLKMKQIDYDLIFLVMIGQWINVISKISP